MNYNVIISSDAKSHISAFRKAGNKILVREIGRIIDELEKDPYTGTGKPERLKYIAGNTWSRRIDSKNRIVYSVEESIITVTVISAAGHYGDK